MSITSAMVEAGILGLAKNALVISGTLGVGNALTASLQPGFSATGLQWTKGGADIAGQTGNSYIQQASDRGAVIGCRAIGLAYAANAGTVPAGGTLVAGQSYANNALISVGANAGVGTGYLQQEANGNVVAVRLCIASKVLSSGVPPTFKAVVATSDTAGSSVDTVWSPNVDGVAYKAQADAQGRGWVPVTFNNGQQSIKMPVAVGSNATSYNAIIRSDRIPLPSRARKSGEAGGPMFLARIENIDPTAQYTSLGGVTYAEYLAQFGTAGIDVFRVAKTNNGAVSNLALAPADTTSGYGHPVWFEFEYATPHISLLIGGDSRYGGGGHPEITGISWMQKPLRAAALWLPINLYNLAGSSHSSASYIALINNYLDAGGRGTHCIVPVHTPNDGLNTTAGADAALAVLRSLIDRLKGLGIKVILSTGYACGYNGNSEIARKYCVAWAKAQNDVILFDTDAIISDITTTPGTGVIKSDYFFSGDNIHCNVAGNAAMATALVSLMQTYG